MTRTAAGLVGTLVGVVAVTSLVAQTPAQAVQTNPPPAPQVAAPSPEAAAQFSRDLDRARRYFEQGQYTAVQRALADALAFTARTGTGAEAVRVGGNIRMPRLLRRVSPVYPDDAKAAKIDGTVFVEAVIGTQGNVTNARVIRSASPSLDAAALDAVSLWEYEPTLLGGKPVAVLLTVTVNFNLRPPALEPVKQ